MEETAQNNILLAEFLGWKRETVVRGRNELTYDFIGEDLLFHVSWDWLMPVVHRCLMIAHNETLNEWENSFADVFLAASIDTMYKEVVAFIQWYNKNKQ